MQIEKLEADKAVLVGVHEAQMANSNALLTIAAGQLDILNDHVAQLTAQAAQRTAEVAQLTAQVAQLTAQLEEAAAAELPAGLMGFLEDDPAGAQPPPALAELENQLATERAQHQVRLLL